MTTTKIATLKFEESLTLAELRCLRGAVMDLAGRECTPFHNHLEGGRLSYGYPLVQYKTINGHAAVVGIADAADVVMRIASEFPRPLAIGSKVKAFHVDSCSIEDYTPIVETRPKLYSVSNYIGLTDENFKRYHSMLALTDRIVLVENILVGNILSFLKRIDCHIDQQLFCAITEFSELRSKSYKRVKFDTFDLSFVSNIELPSGIALGKSGSVGFGVVKREPLPPQFENYT